MSSRVSSTPAPGDGLENVPTSDKLRRIGARGSGPGTRGNSAALGGFQLWISRKWSDLASMTIGPQSLPDMIPRYSKLECSLAYLRESEHRAKLRARGYDPAAAAARTLQRMEDDMRAKGIIQ